MSQKTATKAPILIALDAEKLTEGDYVEDTEYAGVIDSLYIKQVVVFFINGQPHVVGRKTTVVVRLEDDGT